MILTQIIMKRLTQILAFSFLIFTACNSNDDNLPLTTPNLVIKLRFDPNQVRLNNFGQSASIPQSNAAQTPVIQQMSANYIEFASSATTLLGNGEISYEGP